MENYELKCPNYKEGIHLQRPLENYPEEMEFYQCEVCGSVWENEKTEDEQVLQDIRLHQAKGGRGTTIQVNYGNGWEEIKIHIEE